MFDREKLLDDVSEYDNDTDIVIESSGRNSNYKSCYRSLDISELADVFSKTKSEIDFTRLYNVVKVKLCKHLTKILGNNSDDINTVLDNTMVLVYCNIDSFDSSKSKFYTWVCTVADNEARKYIKRSGFKNSMMVTTDFSELYDSSIMVDESSYESYDGPLGFVNEDEGFLDIVCDKATYTVYTRETAIDAFFSNVYECIEFMPERNKIVLTERLINKRKVEDVAVLIGFTGRSVKRFYVDSKKMLVNHLLLTNPYVYEMIKEIY